MIPLTERDIVSRAAARQPDPTVRWIQTAIAIIMTVAFFLAIAKADRLQHTVDDQRVYIDNGCNGRYQGN